MTEQESSPSSNIKLALEVVPSLSYRGVVYIDVDVIPAINSGMGQLFDPAVNPKADEIPPEFIHGVAFALDLYRRVHAGVLSRHAADLVPNSIPDGMV